MATPVTPTEHTSWDSLAAIPTTLDPSMAPNMPPAALTPQLTPQLTSSPVPYSPYEIPSVAPTPPTAFKLFRSHSEGTVGQPPLASTYMSRNKSSTGNTNHNANQKRKTTSSPKAAGNSNKSNTRISRRETIDLPITFTPATHRISKARKGKRVHVCQFAGCEKVFTRAEHRRRHELNHNPQATFVCTIQGCGKGFHRSDLLSRHLEKHETDSRSPKPAAGHKRRISQVSGTSEQPPAKVLKSPMPVEQHRQYAPATAAQTPIQVAITPPIGPSAGTVCSSPIEAHQTTTSLSAPPLWEEFRRSTDPTTGFSHMHYIHSDEPNFFSSPECSRSPSSDGSPYQFQTPQMTSMGQFSEPIVDPLLMATPYQYANGYPEFNPFDINTMQSPQLVPIPFEGDNLRTVGEPSLGSEDCTLPEHREKRRRLINSVSTVMPIPLINLDGDEWTALRLELDSTSGGIPRNDGMGVIDLGRWQDCLQYYWRYFHPLFPVVHRPSFSATQPNSLLAGAMVAIGSQYDRRVDAKEYSLALLEACQNLLKKRGTITSRSSIPDIQSVFLLEYLSKYRSRRADVKISHGLRSLYGSFVQDHHWVSQNPLGLLNSLSEDNGSEGLAKANKFWLDHETRRRVLQAMFILDVHQATLFQLPLAFLQTIPEDRVPKYRKPGFLDLPFPCSRDLWECKDIRRWVELAPSNQPTSLAAASTQAADPNNASSSKRDSFQENLILAFNLLNRPSVEDSMGGFIRMNAARPESEKSIPQSNSTKFIYHALLAARYSPLQALLTVSNESWLFNRKVADEAQFQTAKRTLRAWVSDTEAVKKAVWHATRVLEYTLRAPAPPAFNATQFQPSQQIHESTLLVSQPGFYDNGAMNLNALGITTEPTQFSPFVPSSLPTHHIPAKSSLHQNTHHSMNSNMSSDPLFMLQANWALYISSLICWAYGFGGPSTASPSPNLPSPPPSSPMISHQFYVSTLISLAPSWTLLSSRHIPEHIRRDTSALLEHIRVIIMRGGMLGGLLQEGERVLARLIEPRAPHQKRMWDF